MAKRLPTILFGLCLGLLPALAAGEASPPAARDLFAELKPLPDELARHDYLRRIMPTLSAAQQLQARQLLASADASLGLYRDALVDFPFGGARRGGLSMPAASQWRRGDAADAVTALAATRRIVLVNEAHHDPRTRLLTLALLPRLRALGFTHFAAEALGDADASLARRGYPLADSGSQYLREPVYGNIVREAIRLGFVIVPYESFDDDQQTRETGQARRLYERVLAAGPATRLFVHAGYAHIDKRPGNLGEGIRPMAMELQRLSGIEPLSIDQAAFRGGDPARETAEYRQLVATFRLDRASVLLRRSDDTPWSADPPRHDVSVILPPVDSAARPRWLAMDGQRQAWPIDTTVCAEVRPCVVEAHPAGEPDDATPVDRYALLHADESASLYLPPGRYRVRGWGLSGRTLGNRRIEITR